MYKQTNHGIIHIAGICSYKAFGVILEGLGKLFLDVPFGFSVAAALSLQMIHGDHSFSCDKFKEEKILKRLYDISVRSKISKIFSFSQQTKK